MTTPPTHQPPVRQARDLLAFDRSDRIGLTGTLALVALGSAGVWLAGPLVAWVRGDAISVELTSDVAVPGLEGVRHGSGTYRVFLDDPSAVDRLVVMLPGLVHLVVAVGVCWLLWRVMRSIAAGDPFVPANVSRLRLVAALLVVGLSVAFFADLSVRGAIAGRVWQGGEAEAVLSVPWFAVVVGMVVALLAEAFKAGSRLRDDVEGLV